MVTAAINTLGELERSSLQAIKKYIAATYNVDVERQAPFIKKFLKAAVVKGTLVQTKGKGASGSFKFVVEKAAPKPKAAAKKPTNVKKPAAKAPAKTKAAVSPKAKKAAKTSTAKPKSP
ncbi:histone H1E-like [Microplitis mediator]|uniref:histone H1E-like n=1 Tax=Microplitis mediator TaxID=375433 RepID=UPI002556969A|nr:histone H1E-like [Microplitis mediator]